MTNGEKLEQIFPGGICPFSKGWLSAKYREPKHNPTDVYISLSQVKQIICNIVAEYDTETIHIDRLMNEIDNLPTISLENAIPIPDGATIEDVIKLMFPNCEQKESINNDYLEMYFDNDIRNASYMRVSKEMWNAPYKGKVSK